MRLFLPLPQQLHLRMSDDSDHAAVLFDASQILVYLFLAHCVLPLARVLSEGLLFGPVPAETEGRESVSSTGSSGDWHDSDWAHDTVSGAASLVSHCRRTGRTTYQFL